MKKNDISWDDISFFHRSKHRSTILKLLDNPKTPTQLKKITSLHFNIVSRTIIELEKEGFVNCLTPEQKLARFYQINLKGKKILERLKMIEQ